VIDACAQELTETEDARGKKRARALKAVFAINAVMFVVEATAGIAARSTAMVADSVDMVQDAAGAGTSLAVRNKSLRTQAAVVLGKAILMGGLGVGILAGAVMIALSPAVLPVAATMGIFGGLALVSNAICAGLLYSYRNDNINMKGTWKCTRNDMVSNVGVLGAAAASHLLLSPIPDIVVGAAVSALLIKSSVSLGIEAVRILKSTGKEAQKKPQTPPSLQKKLSPKFAPGLRNAVSQAFSAKAAVREKVAVGFRFRQRQKPQP
jgi:Co/Zn/Cd efflux system component